MTDEFVDLRQKMVETQLAGRDIRDIGVLEAFRRVPRHFFVKDIYMKDSYGDFPLQIGCGQTISQPYMVALMTQCLELTGAERVLEVGTGSGYQSAILAELAKEVYSVERHEELIKSAGENIAKLKYNNIHFKVADGTAGWKEYSPYDAIIVTAGAPDIPGDLIDQLADGGRLVIPVGDRYSQTLISIKKTGGKLKRKKLCGCVFVPLVGKFGWSDIDN